jgi:Fe2+ or Zn2+ uptake regulation protein
MSQLLANRRLEEMERAFRKHGLPVTAQRRIIFTAIIAHEDHPTAEAIYNEIRRKMPSVSRTTVYRILDTFVQLGLITRICHPGSAARFDPKTSQHHHLICLRCESITDLEEDRLNQIPWPNVHHQGFEIRDYHIHFRGICARCRRKQGVRRPTTPGTRGRSRLKGERTAVERSNRKTVTGT